MGALLGQAGVLKSSGGKGPVEDSIALIAAIRLGRTGNELRLVLDAPSPEGSRGEPSLALLKAIARARSWYEKLTTGAVDSLHTIAKQTGLDERYVHRIFQCAYLAPDIVEAVLEGRQPPELTFERFRRPIPIDWDEQRRVLGFSRS